MSEIRHLPVLQPGRPSAARSQQQRDADRNRRHREVRGETINMKRVTQRERTRLRLVVPEAESPYWRPQTRDDCEGVPRPCPYVGCQFNLYLDVAKNGNLKLNFPDIEPGQMPPTGSCALDVAARGVQRLEDVGRLMNITRERVRQIEERAMPKVERTARRLGIDIASLFDDGDS